MSTNGTVLYVHGMGGGADSRIPSILRDCFAGGSGPDVVVRTYSFDPQTAQEQFRSWFEELKPALIIGESLGATHALALRRSEYHAGLSPADLPVILVAPAMNAPRLFFRLAFLALIPGVGSMLDRKYRPRPGERQEMHFRYALLRKWKTVRAEALAEGNQTDVYAFFGKHDKYRRSGIVSVRSWKRLFGEECCEIYDGSHFMEEEYVRTLLADRILETLAARDSR
ncbi:MAG: hypothetical protein Q4G10_02390 [Bacteroidia bacterium]|nr:hypothetical protein [Bacteroidia bacterium]